jgi:GNAT superfamily N-acetyltransferase
MTPDRAEATVVFPVMTPDGADWWRVLGESARIWAQGGRLESGDEYWLAFSGERNVNYNLACCRSALPEVLADRCLTPTAELKKPAIIMLSGAGLATTRPLVDAGWVTVAALPLMTLRAPAGAGTPIDGAGPLAAEQLPAARELLADCYGLDRATAVAAIPDRALEDDDLSAWGLHVEGRLVSCVTSVVQDGTVVIWSMATDPDSQRRGYGRQLLESLLAHHYGLGASGSLLHSSVAGERLYRQLGYTVVEYLQLWSRPRWVLSAA